MTTPPPPDLWSHRDKNGMLHTSCDTVIKLLCLLQAADSPRWTKPFPLPQIYQATWIRMVCYTMSYKQLTLLCLVQAINSPLFQMDQATPSPPDLSSCMVKDGMLHHLIWIVTEFALFSASYWFSVVPDNHFITPIFNKLDEFRWYFMFVWW